MNCKKCGNPITENDKFCPACGEAVEVEAPVEPVAPIMPETPVAPAEPVAPEMSTPVEPAPVASPTPTPIITEPIINNTVIPSEPKKKNGAFIVIILILGLIIVGLGVFIGIKLLGGDKDTTNSTNTNTNNTQTVNNNTNTNTSSNNNTATPTTTTSDTTTTIGSYTFTIPSDIKVIEKDSTKYYGNENLVFVMKSIYYSYNTIVANIDEIKTEFAKQSTILDSKEVTIDGVKYYIFQAIEDGVELEYFYTSLNEYETLAGAMKYQTISREKAYSYINQMLKTKKSGASSFAGNEEKFEIPSVSAIKDTKVK